MESSEFMEMCVSTSTPEIWSLIISEKPGFLIDQQMQLGIHYLFG